ncbi:MAG: DUF1893 domain-containing protein [Sodaliphilus sp.]|jgi:hypothetical protein|nr:DUF1893 domain-containing protein [Bacteroidales bacterium]MDY5380210.1 DUF1893 domain-containing protein [Sodaliphilus sp.]
MQQLIEILRREKCSLVVKNHDIVTTYSKPGVRDLEYLLDHDPEMLHGATIADKVIGKAAAAMVVVGGVKELYAEVMSKRAIPFLEEAGIAYTYGTLVDTIKEEGDRCQLEKITAPATTPEETVALLRTHFEEKKREREVRN